MPVTSIGEYKFPPRDRAAIYGDHQLVYFCWERHMLFAAPFILFVPRDISFGDFLETRIKPLLAPDPDTGSVDWAAVKWSNGPNAFTPDFSANMEANGIGHKDKIIMSTPGLNALMPDH